MGEGNDRSELRFCKDRSLCSKEWVACGPSPVSPDLWAWPALLETKVEHDLHVNHSSRFEALLLALLCSCFPLLAYEVPRQLDFTWASLFIFSWIHTLYWASESSSVPALGALTWVRALDHLLALRHLCMLSCVHLFATPWTVALQAPLSWNFPDKNTREGCHFFLQEIFPTQESNTHFLDWQADSLPLHHLRSPCLRRDMMKAQEFKQKMGPTWVCSLRHTILKNYGYCLPILLPHIL